MTKVLLDLIEVGDRLRGASSEHVAALASSMAEVGLISPITVARREIVRGGIAVSGYGLVAGLHRLEAARALGWADIPAHVVTLDDLQQQLAECDENLCGTKLTPAERAWFTARRKQIYEALHPETRAHVAGAHGANKAMGNASANLAPAFTSDTATRTGRSERDVQRDATRGERIKDDVLAEIKGTDMDRGVVLDAVAKAPDQAAELRRLKAEREAAEAARRNRDTDRAVRLTEAAAFAEWIMERCGLEEIPQIVSWLQAAKPADVISALRRSAA